MTPTWISTMKWPESGLLPAIAQDAATGRVLTLAWQNRLALERTVETGLVHYWSRSRGRLWRKGEESGNVQRVIEIRADCDLDAILLLVDPAGPACHTGAESCFMHAFMGGGQQAHEPQPRPIVGILAQLDAIIAARQASTADKSYTRSLLDQPERARAKLIEEAGELDRAIAAEGDDRVVAEAADLVYHALVACRTRGVDLPRIARELAARFGRGGHEEKASRRNARVAENSQV